MTRITDLTALELVEAILDGDLSPVDVTCTFIDRIRKLDDKINAFITVSQDEALKQAETIEKKLKKGEKTGVLPGIPVAVKDNISTAGLRTTCASKMLENYVPPFDATVIEKLKAEGAVIIGKTNMDEFAMGSTTENSYFGPTRNPWNTNYVPGGSSGGSAAALAASMSPLALGSDTGGSIRCPASFCGVVGLKPTYGLVSRFGLIAYACSLEQIGPMARNVADCALLFSVISGHDPKDSTSLPVKPCNYLERLKEVDLRGLKVAVVKEMISEGVHEAVEKYVWRVIKLLEDLGVKWKIVSTPHLKYALAAYYVTAMAEASSNLARFDGVRYGFSIKDYEKPWDVAVSKVRAIGFGPEVKRRIILGTFILSAGYFEAYYVKALKVRTLIREDFEKIFKHFDVAIGPSMPIPPFRIGEKIENPLEVYLCDIDTVPINLAGIPALSIPCGFYQGLPIGVQFMGAPLTEEKLFRVAHVVEKELKLVRSPL